MDPAVRYLIVLFILILLSAFFSSAETALISVNKIKMRSMSENGNKAASLVIKLTNDQPKMISTILIGNNIVNLSASSISTILVTNQFNSVPIGVATGILTFLILIFGEIIPKTIATLYADTISLIYVPFVYGLNIVLTPVIYILNKLSRFFMLIIRINPDKKNSAITEDEFLTVVDVTHEEGVIETKERDMIENVVDFGDSLAKDIMVPRIDVNFIEDTATYEEIKDVFLESNFSRLPVFHETTDNVIGVLFLKDFFIYSEKPSEFIVSKVARKPYLTFEHKKTSELLTELRSRNLSMAIVLDEYGATAGIITIEDLLEEIVGELRDEYDNDEEDLIKKASDNIYIIDGSAKIDEINEITGLSIPEDYESFAGYVLSILCHIPKKLEITNDENATYQILKMDKKRIDKVKVTVNQTFEETDTP